MQVVVQWGASFLNAWVSSGLNLVPVAAGQWDHEVCEAHIFDEFVWCLAQAQDVFRQVDTNYFLEVVGQFRLESIDCDDL